MSRERVKDKQIPGDELRHAFDTLDILGAALKESIIDFLETRGIILNDQFYYSLSEIEETLRLILGQDATKLMIDRLRRGLQSQK